MTSDDASRLQLTDLVANRTMSAEAAAVLSAAASERRSLLVVAIPRMAGKSTVLEAALEHRPADVPVYRLSEAAGPTLGIPDAGAVPGYLGVSEIAPTPFPDYLWGAPVRRVFSAMEADGHALATALHAEGVAQAIEVVRGNGVTDAHLALLDLVAYIRVFGHWESPQRRVLSELHEVLDVTRGRADTRTIERWDEATDRFELLALPARVSAEAYDRQLEAFRQP
jgi:hypothetical protein